MRTQLVFFIIHFSVFVVVSNKTYLLLETPHDLIEAYVHFRVVLESRIFIFDPKQQTTGNQEHDIVKKCVCLWSFAYSCKTEMHCSRQLCDALTGRISSSTMKRVTQLVERWNNLAFLGRTSNHCRETLGIKTGHVPVARPHVQNVHEPFSLIVCS